MIELRQLSVRLGKFALDDVGLTVHRGEYFVLLGPTGAGKTVLLEAIAGVQPIRAGEIWLAGRDVTRIEPEKRGVSIVYQGQMLFPHLTVRKNIVFGLRIRREPSGKIAAALARVVALLGIEHLLDRRPETLSGGEAQKVALARAIVTEPDILLLDEPLGALDPQSRDGVQQELARLHKSLGLTILHVTHDFQEAITLGGCIAVLGEGKIQQVGLPDEVFRQPSSEFVARFTMAMNVFNGYAAKDADGRTMFSTGGISITSNDDLEGSCLASIRPEELQVGPAMPRSAKGDVGNHFWGVITQITDRGAVVYITVELPPSLECLVTRRAYQEMGLYVGQQACVTIRASSVHLFEG
jgi:ABC-type Fe3+/spermidine/putrescine transport system ATPase subunit